MRPSTVWLGGIRSILILAAALSLAGALWVMPRSSSWFGSWKQALDFAAGAPAFIGPVAAGAACLAYARMRRSAMSDIMLQDARDWWRWLRPATTVWVVAVLVLLGLAATTTTIATMAGVPSYWQTSWILLPAVAVLGAQVAIGAAVGFRTGRLWTAPLVVAGVYSIFLLTASLLIPDIFGTGGVTGPLAGERFVPSGVLPPALVAVGVVVVATVAAHRTMFFATWPRRGIAVLGVAALAVGWSIAPNSNDPRYEPVADPTLTCAGSAPEVCVFEETPRPLADLTRRVAQQVVALHEVRADVPTRFVQSIAGWTTGPTDGVVTLVGDQDVSTTVDDKAATDTLVTPAACPADYSSAPPYAALDARHLMGRWIQVRVGLRTPRADDSDRVWLTGDADGQEEWIRTTYHYLRSCEFEKIQMPSGVG